MRNRQKQNSLWLAGCLIVVISLFAAAMGGLAGYMVASKQTAAPQSGSVVSSEPALTEVLSVAATPLAPTESQSLVITEQSSSVEAVGKVLPAVVTIINQGLMGGASGSGFFISADGYVVTNNHVAEGGQNLFVIYSQGGTAPATIVGTAPEFDLAVLKVDGPVPAVAEWGDSSELPLGAHLIAIGSALGRYQNTVTAGILSGFNRELGPLRGLLQTDAAINSGNSGGPLINLAGQVIGINTLVVRGALSEAEGLGFAIPSNIASTVVRRLIESGDAKPSFLGIQYQELNPQLASQEQLSITKGALIQEVGTGTPAGQAGLRSGDIILAVNGQSVDDRHPLVSLLLEHVAGETVTLEILRDGTTFQTTVTLGERA